MVASLGYMACPYDPRIADWAAAARRAVAQLDTSERRHGGTWFVGVDVLPNAADGSIDGVPMPFAGMVPEWHQAQVSIVYAGYPERDQVETDAAHRFRSTRDAAHMDGLLPEGSQRRRHLREPHGFVLGMPLNDAPASPLVVWDGSHLVMQDAFARAFKGIDPRNYGAQDVTDIYQAARRDVFKTCRRVEIVTPVGAAIFLHRHLIHGVAPWVGDAVEEGRQIAYFRPMVEPARWLNPL